MILSEKIANQIRLIRKMTVEERLRYLNDLIGPPTPDPGELQFRALLMTRLNETNLWPPRGGTA